eukprot:TRINITY_DN17190_c0_g2_i1.p1 TRINITY_DN17190_c0_g2~~TRINITY_DN17190_c0_g2_i1.p1  ORF type:complete len:229 (-),score=22.92 TRINITY_DN17190_c0_g2_i1:689-1330(-)
MGSMDSDTARKAFKVLKQLMRRDESKIYFNDPVDQKLYPDYVTIIKRAMDLGTIHTNLSNGEYKCVQDFKVDLAQVWKNCRTYNEPGSDVYSAALTMEKFTNFLCKQVGLEFQEPAPVQPQIPEPPKPPKLHPLQKCLKLVEELYHQHDAKPFRKPVDGNLITDYYQVIKQPVCLKDIISGTPYGIATPKKYNATSNSFLRIVGNIILRVNLF